MHFALPPRKSSRPLPRHGSRTIGNLPLPRIRKRAIVLVFGILFFLTVLLYSSHGDEPQAAEITGAPEVVIVTVLYTAQRKGFADMIKENRRIYASRHGYATFEVNAADYDLSLYSSPPSWARIPAMRHAMTEYPHSTYFFFVDELSLIMRPEISLQSHITNPDRLEALMIRDYPIVPPDSVIKTYTNLRGGDADLVLTQDAQGLCTSAFIVRRGEWAKYFLDAWFDPLYRAYNFQHAERHALEHLVQWHSTILSKIALVPQHILTPYQSKEAVEQERYKAGDFIAHFKGCQRVGRDCANEMRPFYGLMASGSEEV